MTQTRAAFAAHIRAFRPIPASAVSAFDAFADAMGFEREGATTGLRPSKAAVDLIHSFEQCRLEAYPDPGSRDGHPWTIGWGSTGPCIAKGVRWTQQQADERFEADLAKFAAAVARLVDEVPTTQNQFDALCSLAYNIGIGSPDPAKKGGLTRSTVLRLHRAGDHEGAAEAFAMWNKNDGKVMRGLVRRRAAEAALYRGQK